MKTQADNSSCLAPLITGIAIVLFSSAGIARMMGWGSNSSDDSGAPEPTMSEARANARCAECGMIVSVREIERHDGDTGPDAAEGAMAGSRKSTRSYEIIVRMADGSSRVIFNANPARWRTGERMMVIDGTSASHK